MACAPSLRPNTPHGCARPPQSGLRDQPTVALGTASTRSATTGDHALSSDTNRVTLHSAPRPCRISILTACLPERAEHLAAAATSVATVRAELSPLTVEWVVALDGPGDADTSAADKVVRLPRRGGVSAARNAALRVAEGDLVTPLDADDMLDATGVLAAERALRRDDHGWVGANRIMLGSGRRTAHWHGPREWEAGEYAASWTSPSAFHPNSFVARRDLVLRCGGWPALTTNEDLLLVLRLSEEAAGRSIEEVLTHYRVWSGQVTTTGTYAHEKADAFLYIEQVINAVRARAGRPQVDRPSPGRAQALT